MVKLNHIYSRMKVDGLVALIGREKKLKKDDPNYKFIATAYNNLASLLKTKFTADEVITTRKLEQIEGITPHMLNKLKLLLLEESPLTDADSGRGHKSGQAAESKKNSLLEKLDDLLGIGEKRAQQLVDMGLKDIKDLKMKKWQEKLPLDAQYFMKYKPLRKIPHDVIQKFEKYFHGLMKSLHSTAHSADHRHNIHESRAHESRADESRAHVEVIFTGSYRRKKPYSRDVDIMVVSEDVNILDAIIEKMQKKSVLHIYAHGKDKVSFLMEIEEGKTKKYIKVDIFRTLPENKIPMLTYSTGSKNFNIKMRSIAKRRGYLLNQMGLYKEGNSWPETLNSEKDLFDLLGMKYLEPPQRDI